MYYIGMSGKITINTHDTGMSGKIKINTHHTAFLHAAMITQRYKQFRYKHILHDFKSL